MFKKVFLILLLSCLNVFCIAQTTLHAEHVDIAEKLALDKPEKYSPDVEGARGYIESLAQTIYKIGIDQNLDVNIKKEKLENLMIENANIINMSKLVLGKHWRTLTETQRQEFIKLYKDFLLYTYLPTFLNNVSKYSLKINNAVEMSNNSFMVYSTYSLPNSVSAVIKYKVIYSNGIFKIEDLIAENISIVAMQRADFSSVLSNATFDDLKHMMVEKIEESKKEMN